MKYILVSIVIQFFSLSLLYGQPLLDFAAGVNYPVIPYTDYYDYADVDSKASYMVGAGFNASLYRNLYYTLGINYNHFLAHLVGSSGSASHATTENIDLKLGYVSFSVMPEYSIGKNRLLFIRAGGYFSLLVNSKEVGTFDTRVVNGDHHIGEIERDARDDYKNIDYGLSASAGIRLKISDKAWFVPQIGYITGLYKYNLTGSNIQDVKRSGFKSVYFVFGIDMGLDSILKATKQSDNTQ